MTASAIAFFLNRYFTANERRRLARRERRLLVHLFISFFRTESLFVPRVHYEALLNRVLSLLLT